jgi:hypothetical protein
MAIPTTKTRHLGHDMRDMFEAARAEALFASTLQPSESPSPDQVRHAVAATMRTWGIRGCAAQLAGEYGDHPDTAAARMTWALATIRAAYPTWSTTSTPALTLRPLPLPLVSRRAVAG